MKQSYEMPQIEVVELELEGIIANSPTPFSMESAPELPSIGDGNE